MRGFKRAAALLLSSFVATRVIPNDAVVTHEKYRVDDGHIHDYFRYRTATCFQRLPDLYTKA
jgi:hypothetical protein